MRVLFIGDVVGKPGREGLAAAMPALREEHLPDLVIVNGENAGGGVGITPDTAKEIFDVGRRGDHPRQPHLPPPRGLLLPGVGAADHPPRELPRGEPGPRPRRRRRRGDEGGRRQPQRPAPPPGRALALPGRRRDHGVPRGLRRRGDRRLPRRADQREGRDGLAPRRPRRGGPRHPHPRPHRRRPGPAGRHRPPDRRRDDRARARGSSASSASRRSRRSGPRCRSASRPPPRTSG